MKLIATFTVIIILIALLLFVIIGGSMGFFLCMLLISCIFWKIPNVIQSFKNIEKHN